MFREIAFKMSDLQPKRRICTHKWEGKKPSHLTLNPVTENPKPDKPENLENENPQNLKLI